MIMANIIVSVKLKIENIFQVKYGKLSQKQGKKWYMPSRYYTFKKGDVEFFALDANVDKQTQKK